MTTDNKTLADVQPGGKVRLEDQATPSKDGWNVPGRIDTAIGYLTTALDDLDSCPDRRPGIMVTEALAVLREILSAQRSPGGQEEAREQFETWATSRGWPIQQWEGGLQRYCSYDTERMWEAFQAALAARQPVGDQHPDDLAVDEFAAAMKAKMAEARAKGRGGWEDPAQCTAEDLSRMLRDHVEKGDPRDVANFCMMLHQRREAIAARQPVESEENVAADTYWTLAEMIEPHVQREGINPNGALPASVHDSVAILLEHWLRTRQPVGDPVGYLYRVVVSEAGASRPWVGRGIVFEPGPPPHEGVRRNIQYMSVYDRPQTAQAVDLGLQLDRYDAGLLGDGGGGDVNWWQDYIRAELDRAHEFYQDQADAHG